MRIAVFLAFLIAGGAEEYSELLERLRADNPGEHAKVLQLSREEGLRFLRERYGKRDPEGAKPPLPGKPAEGDASKAAAFQPLPARMERFTLIETFQVDDISIDICRREDGAFGLGEIRRNAVPLRRADFLITWKIGGKLPVFAGRKGGVITLKEPDATLTFRSERREAAGAAFAGFSMELEAAGGPIVETASWEPGGTTRGKTYFDGYRGWHAPPAWLDGDRVPQTNPKLMPSILAGTGFQFLHGSDLSLLHFHTSPGDQVQSASRGEVIELESSFLGPAAIRRFILTTGHRDSRINLWTRAFEVAHAELGRSLGIPPRGREIACLWPTFRRQGFEATALQCAKATAEEGFTCAVIDVVWDNIEFHGGAKNMNVWDYSVCAGYGGDDGLRALVDECRKQGLGVIAWAPAGHLNGAAPIWKEHPDWVLKDRRGEKALNPSGLWQGDLNSGFAEYFRGRMADVVRRFGLDGLWMDSHLAYAQQRQSPSHGAKLAVIYLDFIKAGARQLIVEGDASAIGSYGIGIDESWGSIPEPDLYYGSSMLGWPNDPRIFQDHFRRYVAAGAAWVVSWDFLFSRKLAGEAWEAARREVRSTLKDYRKVKDLMVHRFVEPDGAGYRWTNDQDRRSVLWLLKDAALPDGTRGRAGGVYVLPGR